MKTFNGFCTVMIIVGTIVAFSFSESNKSGAELALEQQSDKTEETPHIKAKPHKRKVPHKKTKIRIGEIQIAGK